MIINNAEANSQLEQVAENKANIAKLAQVIKTVYNCTIELATTASTVNSANIRNWENTTDAFIVDTVGNVFNVLAVSDSTIYIEYWLHLPQGLQGEAGPQGPQGQAGVDGVGISSVALTNEKGLDFTLTDGSHLYTASVQGPQGAQGVGIQSIEKTGTVDNVDTYTITLTNGSTSTFTVTNAQGGVRKYMHIMKVSNANSYNFATMNIFGFTLVTEDAEAYQSFTYLWKKRMYEQGFRDSRSTCLPAIGTWTTGSVIWQIVGVATNADDENDSNLIFYYKDISSGAGDVANSIQRTNVSIQSVTDVVIPL